jgi:hypothetical protein
MLRERSCDRQWTPRAGTDEDRVLVAAMLARAPKDRAWWMHRRLERLAALLAR